MGFVKIGKGKIKQVFRFIKKVNSNDFELKKIYDDEEPKKEDKPDDGIKQSSA